MSEKKTKRELYPRMDKREIKIIKVVFIDLINRMRNVWELTGVENNNKILISVQEEKRMKNEKEKMLF